MVSERVPEVGASRGRSGPVGAVWNPQRGFDESHMGFDMSERGFDGYQLCFDGYEVSFESY